MILDFRNDPFNPTTGTILSGDVKIGDGLLNQLPTVRLSGALSTLQPMDRFRWKIGLSWGIGRTNDDSPLPLEDRFFLGGSNSMRGLPVIRLDQQINVRGRTLSTLNKSMDS